MYVTRTRFRLCATFFLALCLCGCMKLGPDFKRPDAQLYDTWAEDGADGLKQGQAVQNEWWKTFGDPELSKLVRTAFDRNLTLRVAGLRVIEGRAQLGIAVGQLYPQSQAASGGYTYSRESHLGPSWPQPSTESKTTSPDQIWQNTVAFSAAWELDFWGKYRRGIESADAAMRASAADYDNALVSLAGDVARTYLDLRINQAQLKIAHENVELEKEGLKIAEARFRYGATSERDVQQAKTMLLSTEATIPGFQSAIKKNRHALSVLLGLPPDKAPEGLTDSEGIPAPPWEIAVGVPADLLRRRPDVRAAEYAAMAQCAQIGVAKADLFPSFSLTGSIGFLASNVGVFKLSELLSNNGFTAQFSPQFGWNLFNYGRIIDNVRVQDAKFQALLIQYQQTVLTALREVEDAMTAYIGASAQVVSLAKAADAAKRSADLAFIQYSEGKTDYTTVLVAQQQLLKQQDDLVQMRGQVATSLVSLYRALGGGWQVRQGLPYVPEDVRHEMEKRTWWGRQIREDPAKITNPDTRNILWYAPDI
ncbi:RND efflux system, outer membrane lipoprotein, NodT family [Solidesulfovibrio fructosivorans JJ]]|uniref:RND efflux system, outer membrane lipoprotein, NodT family n=1 Tax=Solidesulfovibrio fructosivorans JJ] TaxID=596151 RepID=E1JSX7_SOLFR|nr:efflux transporter outer membrane subunit [Solidesulfovibrio fructosivorans]EFL52610.1 RND efflux system, outer membrane lipoprotein, NodT family [Solidesulfovibrio fructosivorans JJ]]